MSAPLHHHGHRTGSCASTDPIALVPPLPAGPGNGRCLSMDAAPGLGSRARTEGLARGRWRHARDATSTPGSTTRRWRFCASPDAAGLVAARSPGLAAA